jgi:hypothetical protein
MNNDNSKKKKKAGGFVRFLEEKTSLPSDAFARDSSIEIRERRELCMRGCRRIIKYSPDEMILAGRGFEVRIRGEGLVCTSYNYGAVTVEGEISGVDLGVALSVSEEV